MNTKTLCFLASILMLPAGCGGHVVPCSDCEADDAAEQDDAPLPDLPCGGADLMTDNLNCGSCGHECVLNDEGTPYEAGTCNMGECGPLWSACLPEVPTLVTCADVCEGYDRSCVAKGCSGYTGILYDVNLDGWGCGVGEPSKVMTEGCDAPIPWMTTGDNPLQVMCCCDFQ